MQNGDAVRPVASESQNVNRLVADETSRSAPVSRDLLLSKDPGSVSTGLLGQLTQNPFFTAVSWPIVPCVYVDLTK